MHQEHWSQSLTSMRSEAQAARVRAEEAEAELRLVRMQHVRYFGGEARSV